MRAAILIPVAPEEPLAVVEKSLECILKLDKNGLDLKVIYILDRKGDFDERVEYLKQKRAVEVLVRSDRKGRRAGAMNHALENLDGDYDYIAIFDVDSRPEPDFLLECIAVLERDPQLAIASSPRFVTNDRDSFPARIVAVEYRLIGDMYRLINWSSGFLQFNGLIGVVDGKILISERLREDVRCEDTEFTERIYLRGRRAALTKKTQVGEQAPITWSDLYHQRVRWYTGAYEGLKLYSSSFLRSDLPKTTKFSWLASMTLPFVIVVFMPLLPLYSKRIWGLSNDVPDFLARFPGIVCYVFLLQFCGTAVLIRKLLGREAEWSAIRRSDA